VCQSLVEFGVFFSYLKIPRPHMTVPVWLARHMVEGATAKARRLQVRQDYFRDAIDKVNRAVQ
jgi:hypothetical protein